jgi:hypothetical protein
MITALFLAFVAAATIVALTDWQRGLLLVLVVGVLQDPVRKLTPGAPIALTFAVLAVVAAMMFSSHVRVFLNLRDFTTRFGDVSRTMLLVLAMLVIAALNGIATFGIGAWKAPMLSFALYTMPVAAILFGYTWLQREEMAYRFMSFYAIVTSVALVGSVLEYLRIDFPGLGLVASYGDYIRHLPGLQIRMVSGFYRAPDIMGWHAAMLASISMAMAVRAGLTSRVWPWLAAMGWGFFNCMISGRRKAIYFVLAFGIVFVWRYFRRLHLSQFVAMVVAGGIMLLIVRNLSSNEKTSVYTRGAVTTREEVFSRLEGGLFATVDQVGIMGAGLGSATQGVRYMLGTENDIGWQEGGLGKLAVEIGIPGLLAVAFLMLATIRLFLLLTRIGDVPGSSQLLRVTLFAITIANAVNFMAAAQAYTDPVLGLLTAFFVGCLFATATLDERLVAEQAAAQDSALAPAGRPAPATA